MSISITIQLEDVATQILIYNQVKVESASSAGGIYAPLGTAALVSGTFFYTFLDNAGTFNTWYRYYLYNSVSFATSPYSIPFRPEGLSLLKIRQECINTYRMGMILVAGGGVHTATKTFTSDFRFKTATYANNRGKNSALRIASGTRIGQMVLITGSVPSTGEIDHDALTGAVADGDQVEWTWMIDPINLDMCINKGLQRYYFIDRVAIAGVDNQTPYSLDVVPWLKSKHDITGLWWVPPWQTTETSWVGGRRWYALKEEEGEISFDLYPTIDPTITLFLEAIRQAPELPTDDSVLPGGLSQEMVAAFAYDEVLSWLLRPGVAGSAEDRKAWDAERKRHQARLLTLARQYRVRPRYALPTTQTQQTVPNPVSARGGNVGWGGVP